MQKMRESPSDPLSICIIGAGFSGLCAAIQLKRQLTFNHFKIIDKNEDFGGVWWSNRYPGCASDVNGHLYSLSFEPNTDWSKGFVPQSETLDYIKKVADKYSLYKNTIFRHNVERAEWDDPSRKWNVFVCDLNTRQKKKLTFDIMSIFKQFINEQNFGTLLALMVKEAWNNDIQLDGRKVAVIGTGSTGAQLIPSIAPRVGHLTVFIRNPPYVVPPVPITYSPFRKWCFKYIPFVHWMYRCYLFLQNEKYFAYLALGSKMNLAGKAFCRYFIQQEIKDKTLAEKMIPSYEFGCKRIIPSLNFYPALNRDNVTVITSKLVKVDEKTLITEDGHETKPDVLILATGFHVQDTYSSFQLIGRNGADIHKIWSEKKPSAYLGIMTSEAPNYFILIGPNTSTGYNTILFTLECQVLWMIQVIRKLTLRRSNDKNVSVSVLPAAEIKYMTELNETMKDKVYVDQSCANSWVRNSKGDVAEIYPDTTFSYWKKTYWLDQNILEFR